MIIDKGCNTCKNNSCIEGGCTKKIVNNFELDYFDNLSCPGYEITEFYKRLQ